MKKRLLLFVLMLLIIYPAAAPASASAKTLNFGVLPVIQALPLFVADEAGFFKAEGIDVKIVPFRTALDKDVAMTTGKIDGNFGDLFTATILKNGGADLRLVARNTTSLDGVRMFGVLAAPGSGINTINDLAGVPVAVSTNTIIDYVTLNLMTRAGMSREQAEFMEVKNIPVRFQMLLTGQIKAATLPEPLVTLAETKGCKILADDAGTDFSQTVIMFSNDFIKAHPDDVVKFINALKKAVELINSGDESVRAIMNKSCRIPKPLHDIYPVLKFPKPAVPTRAEVMAAVNWLEERGVLKTKLEYEDLVDAGFIRE